MLKMEHDFIYEQVAKGAIIQSKAKNFLNLETHEKAF